MSLPELTDRQFGFVMDLKAGKSASDAYRRNFDVADWKPNSIWAKASTLKSSEKVQAWLEHLARENIERAVLSHQEYVGMLMGLAERAENAKNYGAAAMVVKTLGQTSGHHKDTVEIIDNRTEQQLMDELEKLKREAEKEGLSVH